jgi:hypothetical protein
MKRSRLASSCALLFLLMAGTVGMGAASAGERCKAPLADWKPGSAVYAMAGQKHWHIDRLKVDDGCYKIRGTDADGRPFKARLDPVTLDVIDIKGDGDHHGRHGDGERERHRRGRGAGRAVDDAGAGAVTPPAGASSERILTPGSKPDVQIR